MDTRNKKGREVVFWDLFLIFEKVNTNSGRIKAKYK